MVYLPEARFISSPLFILAVALSAGILAGHYVTLHATLVAILSGALGIGLGLTSFSLIVKKHSSNEKHLTVASAFLISAFFCSGFTLSLISDRPPMFERVARMYDAGLIASGEPVELTGVVQGQPEAAPDSFYLTLRVESIRSKGAERTASSTVLLLAHAREQRARDEYDELELRHGARVRVMTTLDREVS